MSGHGSRRGLFGLVVEAAFTHVLRGVAKDREHTRVELRYLKRIIEGDFEPA